MAQLKKRDSQETKKFFDTDKNSRIFHKIPGNWYLSGYSQGSLDGYSNIGNRDVILLKYDKSGKIEWSSQFGTTSNDEGKGIKNDSQNNVYVVGTTYSGIDGNTYVGQSDLFLFKYNDSGLKQWSRQLGTSNIAQALSLFLDNSNNIFLTGRTNSDMGSNANKDNKSDYFIDNKFTQFDKEECYLLCSGEDIVWIIGHRMDDRFKITDDTKKVYIAELF